MDRDLSDVRFLTVAEVADMMRVSSMTVSHRPSTRPSATSARLLRYMTRS